MTVIMMVNRKYTIDLSHTQTAVVAYSLPCVGLSSRMTIIKGRPVEECLLLLSSLVDVD